MFFELVRNDSEWLRMAQNSSDSHGLNSNPKLVLSHKRKKINFEIFAGFRNVDGREGSF